MNRGPNRPSVFIGPRRDDLRHRRTGGCRRSVPTTGMRTATGRAGADCAGWMGAELDQKGWQTDGMFVTLGFDRVRCVAAPNDGNPGGSQNPGRNGSAGKRIAGTKPDPANERVLSVAES